MQVMYDASGVRLHAGRQASVLNMIITELPPDHPVSDTRPLRDSLGHTPLQVSRRPQGIARQPLIALSVCAHALCIPQLLPAYAWLALLRLAEDQITPQDIYSDRPHPWSKRDVQSMNIESSVRYQSLRV